MDSRPLSLKWRNSRTSCRRSELEPMGAKQRRIQQMVAAEMRRPSEEFRSELVPVEISLGCRDLPILAATGSCLSVFAVLWIRKQGSERWQEHGRTEVVRSGSAPQFARSFFLDYLDHDDVLRNEEYDTWPKPNVMSSQSPKLGRLGEAPWPLGPLG